MKLRTAVFLTAALTLLVIALSTGRTAYYLISIMMLATALLALVSAAATVLTLSVGTAAQKKRAVRGEAVGINLTIRRRSILPVGQITLEVSSPDEGGEGGRIALEGVPFRGRMYHYAVRCAHRGVYRVGVSRADVTDVFGLFSFSRAVRGDQARIEVLPRTGKADPVAIQPADNGPQGRVRMTEDMASPSGVRTWQEGDELKKVHWKLTARRRELMVRTFEETARPDLLILMDCAPVNAMKSRVRTVEDALCEAAADAALAQLRAGYAVRMPLNAASPAELAGQMPGEIGRFLEALAWLKFDSPYSFEQVLTLEMRRLQRTGAAILIGTRLNAQLAEMALRMKRLGVDVRMIWVAESAHRDYIELEERLNFMGVPVRRVNPFDVEEDSDARRRPRAQSGL